ncbi:MAG: PAS domain-containing protein [Rhizobacter sp.]|nr:PAS domain-containing protein [Burkholderiaceae bacterium]MCO5124262.1 PAS domain-containing protein [Rhizobacter sp.]
MPLSTGDDPSGAPPNGVVSAWAACTRELLALVDGQGRLAWCNRPFEQLLSRRLPALIGEPLWELLPVTEAGLPTLRNAAMTLERGEPFGDIELELRTAVDSTAWLRIEAHRADTAAVNPQWLCVMRDVSDSARHAQEAARLQDLLTLAQSFGRLGMWERDLRTGAGRWDAQVYRLYGFDPADGVPPLDQAVSRIHPEDRAQFSYGSSNIQPGRHDKRYRLIHPDGSLRWLQSQWEVRTAPDGTLDRAMGILVDDTDAYQLAQALGSTSAQLKLAIELGNIAIWRHDLRSDRVTCNERAHQVFGLPVGVLDFALEDMRSRIHPDDAARVAATAARALASERPTDIEARFADGEGHWRTLMTRRVVERAEDGTPIAFVGIALDVTQPAEERRRATEQLRRMEFAAAAVGVGVWSFDLVTREAQWSAQVFALIGREQAPQPPSLGELKHQIIFPGDWEDIEAAMTGLATSAQGTLVHSFRVRLPSGETRWIEDRARREVHDGKPLLSGVAFDVTERRKTEAALRSADERAALATRSAGIGTWELSLVGPDQRWDAQMFRLRGLEPRDAPPTREERLAIVHPDDRHVVFDTRPDLLTDREPAKYEFRVRWPDGSEHWLASRSIAVLDDSGRPVGRLGVNWDITESRLAEAERQAGAIARRENLAKSQFLSRVSHELRTPLNAVLGFTQLMQSDDALAAGHKARLALIRSAGEHLLLLINDMLDLTGLDTGELRLEPQPVGLAALVRETLPLVEPLAAQYGVGLQVDGVAGVAHADRTRLRQVLINLLTNGIKYNRPQGSVTIRARPAAAATVVLEVSDTGRGIAAEQLAHLFEPFNRLGAESEGIEGSGIGLVIVKALVERMGGSVSVTSEPQRGASFTVTLPAASEVATRTATQPAPGAAASQIASHASAAPEACVTPIARTGRVLYIEDNAVNVLLVQEIVAQRPGIELSSAADGEEGVRLALEQRPQLILVDMQLPDFDGFEVLRRLRAAPGGGALRCIALSANALPEDIARALAAGFADYWTKPIDFRQFLAGLDTALATAA